MFDKLACKFTTWFVSLRRLKKSKKSVLVTLALATCTMLWLFYHLPNSILTSAITQVLILSTLISTLNTSRAVYGWGSSYARVRFAFIILCALAIFVLFAVILWSII